MAAISQELSEAALIRAVKGNFIEFFLYGGQAAGDLAEIEPGIHAWFTGVPHPWFNGVIARRPPAGEAQPAIQEALRFFSAHHIPAFTWWNDPVLAASAWNEPLQAAGFSYAASTPGMAVDIEKLQSPRSAPDRFTVQPVTGLDMLTTWVAVFTQGYPIPEAWSQVFYTMLAGMGLDQPVRNYLGYLDGRPVATANLFLGAGVAGIYCVATLPEARGRGIGAEMTLAPLGDARQMGYRIGILQSSEMGYRVYERLGFRTVCMMDHYSWKDPDLDSPA